MKNIIRILCALPFALLAGQAQAHFVPAPCDFITGGGWVFADSGAKANFGAHGGCKHGAFWGHVNVVDHTYNPPGHLRSTRITGYLMDPAFPNARDICGEGVINNSTAVRFRVRMEDNGEPGGLDRFGRAAEQRLSALDARAGTRGTKRRRRQYPTAQAQPVDHRALAGAHRVRDVRRADVALILKRRPVYTGREYPPRFFS
ncbi:MAG: post-COAP-1 domain-containing protein [Burkholderiales bacterium]